MENAAWKAVWRRSQNRWFVVVGVWSAWAFAAAFWHARSVHLQWFRSHAGGGLIVPSAVEYAQIWIYRGNDSVLFLRFALYLLQRWRKSLYIMLHWYCALASSGTQLVRFSFGLRFLLVQVPINSREFILGFSLGVYVMFGLPPVKVRPVGGKTHMKDVGSTKQTRADAGFKLLCGRLFWHV